MQKRVVQKSSRSGSKQVIIAIVIAFISVFFLAYAIQSVYPAPEYNDYCKNINTFKAIDNKAECETMDGIWYESNDPKGSYCDLFFKCSQAYEEERKPYERNLFVLHLILGMAVLIISFFLGVEAISSGFMAGGAMMLIYGVIRYWGNLSNILRTVVLGVALVIIVFFAYKRFK